MVAGPFVPGGARALLLFSGLRQDRAQEPPSRFAAYGVAAVDDHDETVALLFKRPGLGVEPRAISGSLSEDGAQFRAVVERNASLAQRLLRIRVDPANRSRLLLRLGSGFGFLLLSGGPRGVCRLRLLLLLRRSFRGAPGEVRGVGPALLRGVLPATTRTRL
jgi:hypothetical protein